MTQRIFKSVCFVSLLFFGSLSFSADEVSNDLSLDDQFSPAPETAAPAPNPMDEFATSPTLDSELTASQDLNSQNNVDPAENVNLASPVEALQRTNALFGFSAGLVLSSQPFNLKYTVEGSPYSQYKEPFDIKTGDFQNVGIMLRYAMAPFGSIGADLNISYLKSQNHSSIAYNNTSFSEIVTLRGELNLTYAIEMTNKVPVYFLLGFGAQKVNGGVIENLIQPMGYGGQAGAGFAINSTINLEGVYSYYVHRINKNYANAYSVESIKGYVDTEKAEAINQGLLVRGSFSFNF